MWSRIPAFHLVTYFRLVYYVSLIRIVICYFFADFLTQFTGSSCMNFF